MGGEAYYSLEEVMRLLNKSKSTVIREANSGLIPSEIEDGKKRGRQYPKTAINALLEIQQAKNRQRQTPRLIFLLQLPTIYGLRCL